MQAAEMKGKTEAQISLIDKAILTAIQTKALMEYRSVDIVGPFGVNKDYSLPQLDEFTNEQADTYKQQEPKVAKLPKEWWGEADPATWAPHGWKPTDAIKWNRYARMATEEGNGLEAFYQTPHSQMPWDPTDPLTWVPFGWRIKDPNQWRDWHADQSSEGEGGTSPHEGLLAPDSDWYRVQPGSITDTPSEENMTKDSGADPHANTAATFQEAHGVGVARGQAPESGKFSQAAQQSGQPKTTLAIRRGRLRGLLQAADDGQPGSTK